uniref:Globin family profile domain-containing protein n=1 Tax=Romanomermis culicivorax TaxID=13658 RepID=A0A915JF47_ROMCU
MGVTASTRKLNKKKLRNNDSNYSTSNEYLSSMNFTAMPTSLNFYQILDDETAKKILIASWRSIDDKFLICQRIMIKFIFKQPKLMAVFQLNSIGAAHFTTTSNESDPIFFRHAEKLVDVFDRLIDAVSTSDEKLLKYVASTIGVR